PAAILVASLISFPAPKFIPEFLFFFAESSRPAGRTHVFRKSLSCKDLQSSARNSTSRKFFADKDL
ncbi:MAG TPA: hypothetical protein VG406_20445, partial [Isosphaeraceae bacterium]|nr:hypothetical protein [Isosphaeraceae bacterium]